MLKVEHDLTRGRHRHVKQPHAMHCTCEQQARVWATVQSCICCLAVHHAGIPSRKRTALHGQGQPLAEHASAIGQADPRLLICSVHVRPAGAYVPGMQADKRLRTCSECGRSGGMHGRTQTAGSRCSSPPGWPMVAPAAQASSLHHTLLVRPCWDNTLLSVSNVDTLVRAWCAAFSADAAAVLLEVIAVHLRQQGASRISMMRVQAGTQTPQT